MVSQQPTGAQIARLIYRAGHHGQHGTTEQECLLCAALRLAWALTPEPTPTPKEAEMNAENEYPTTLVNSYDADPMSPLSLLDQMVNHPGLYGHYCQEGEGVEVGNWIPAAGVDEVSLGDWLARARTVLETNRG